MAAALLAVLRSCMESFKTILTSQEFGTEYELLCTELATQWLRIRLWGDSLGLNIGDSKHLQNSLSTRPEIESTITQCVSAIAYLLTEIELLRRKYELRPPLIPDEVQDAKSLRACKSLSTLSDLRRPAASLRQRMRDNQMQKSFLAITKWAMCDARRFDEKVKRLKTLVDGLEDISQAAGIIPAPPRRQSSPITATPSAGESPPPYSVEPPSSEQAPRLPTAEPRAAPSVSSPSVSPPSVTSPVVLNAGILAHHVALKRFIGLRPENARSHRARARLLELSEVQFKELRMDVYDEMVRRQFNSEAYSVLPSNPDYHPKRNTARHKLSTLPGQRFKDLCTDVLHELERRYTSLQLQVIDEIERAVQTPASSFERNNRRTLPASHRHGLVLSPPPLLRDRASHPSMLPQPWSPVSARQRTSHIAQQAPTALSSPISPYSPANSDSSTITTDLPALSPSTTPPSSAEIFKSFRVSMEDPTWKVIPAALKKYHVNAPAENYALHLLYGNKERCLRMDEKPLKLFKQLDKEGKKPMFMLRKIVAVSVARPEPGVQEMTGHDI